MAELTPRAIFLGIVLGIVLTAANAYLSLYAGMTVSASIPAAVLSMGILRGLLKRGTILENNIVQTIAASGEAMAAGIVFTVPALLITGVWTKIEFLPTALICITGALLGIIFMIPLRRQHIVEDKRLTYPEGTACAEVLIAGDKGGKGARILFMAMAVGGVFKAVSAGISFLKGTVEWAFSLGKFPLYIGADISAALLGVGYIVGPAISVQAFSGSFMAWVIAIPFFHNVPAGESLLDWFWTMWATKIRYLGVGCMLVGGAWSLVEIRKGMVAGVKEAVAGYRSKTKAGKTVSRIEKSIGGMELLVLFLVACALMLWVYQIMINDIGITLLSGVFSITIAFLFTAIGSYIVGLVGSSNSPVSGVTICALILTASLLVAVGLNGPTAILATMGVTGVMCCAIVSAGDISQDLKTGQLVGATPRNQQWMEVVGAIIPAFIIPFVLTVLHTSYGIGTGTPTALKAPQAALFASLANGFFGTGVIPWDYVGLGALIGIALIVTDQVLRVSNVKRRLPVMPIGIGLYLPMTVTFPVALGGLVASLVKSRGETDRGTLFASGLIAGEAVIGVLIGFIIYMKKGLLPIPVVSSDILTVAAFVGLGALLLKVAKGK